MVVDHSVLHFFTDASTIVKGVMLVLLCASLISWTIIFQRGSSYRRLRKATRQFEETFWSGLDLTQLYSRITQKKIPHIGLAAIFQSGFESFLHAKKEALPQDVTLENTERAMAIAENKEIDEIEQYLPILATIGSTSPYIGLFGTVWGIMTSFQALGQSEQATIAMVAPGISEALIATAMGLFAAIPAVIAYNRYAHSADRLANHYTSFRQELTGILQRRLYKAPSKTQEEHYATN